MVSARLASVFSAVVLAGCGADDPEGVIRERLAAAERAAEARETGFFRDLLAADYVDAHGNDRDQMIDAIRGYFLTHSAIEIVSRVDEVTLADGEAARAVMHVGMIGRRAGESLLGGAEGELYRIELEMIEDDGDWRVARAAWNRALGD
jgi:hypothetical protein